MFVGEVDAAEEMENMENMDPAAKWMACRAVAQGSLSLTPGGEFSSKCFLANALPEPLLRYRSKFRAKFSVSKAK